MIVTLSRFEPPSAGRQFPPNLGPPVTPLAALLFSGACCYAHGMDATTSIYRVIHDKPLWRVFFVHPGHERLWRQLGEFHTEREARAFVDEKPSPKVGRPPRLSSAAEDVQARMDVVLKAIRTLSAAGELINFRRLCELTHIPQGSMSNYVGRLAKAGIVRVPAPGGNPAARIGIVLVDQNAPAPPMGCRAVAWSRRKRVAEAPSSTGEAAPTPPPARPIPPLRPGVKVETLDAFLARGGEVKRLEAVPADQRPSEVGTRTYGRVPIG